MVIGAFPVAKLGTLLLKQISKPIANAAKHHAKSHPIFRKYVCMPPAQVYNWFEVKTKMWVLNLGKPVNIPVLNEAMAIELGANLLGEIIIFAVAAAALIFEYNRQSNKEALKEQNKKEEMDNLRNTIQELFFQSEEQGAQIRELTRKIAELDRQHLKPPKTPPSSSPPQLKPLKEPCENLPPKNKENNHQSLILNAVNELRNDLWSSNNCENEDSIVTFFLHHLYKNVLKMNNIT